MSRVFARGFDLLQASKNIQLMDIEKYKKDKRRISWDDIDMGADYIEKYLSEDAKKLLLDHPIRVVKTPLSVYTKSTKPSIKDETVVSFPSLHAYEEYKRELIFLLGVILSVYNPDKKEEKVSFYVPDEFRDVLPLYLEYLYMKESGQTDKYALKRLNEIKTHVDSYINAYIAYNKRIVNCEDLERFSFFLSNGANENVEDYKLKSQEKIDNIIYNTLVPFSSMDATLQLIDMDLGEKDIKELLDYLYKNEDQNRSEFMRDLGIETVGFKRLTKEFEKYKR